MLIVTIHFVCGKVTSTSYEYIVTFSVGKVTVPDSKSRNIPEVVVIRR